MSERPPNSASKPVQARPTAALPSAETAPKPVPGRLDRLPIYRVLLHKDIRNKVIDVVETICDLTPLNLERAAAATVEAHNAGIALLLTTHRERAELYVEQFRSKSMTVTIEPAE